MFDLGIKTRACIGFLKICHHPQLDIVNDEIMEHFGGLAIVKLPTEEDNFRIDWMNGHGKVVTVAGRFRKWLKQ